MDKPDNQGDRAISLFFTRCSELLTFQSNMTRRARTLCFRTATEEAWRLAVAYLKTGGNTNTAAEPSEAAHGVKTLPQVAEEALELLGDDYVIKRRISPLIDVIRPILQKLTREDPQHTHADVGQLKAVVDHLEQCYVDCALHCIETLLSSKSTSLFELESVCEVFISDLRARGWTNRTLSEIFLRARTEHDAIKDRIKLIRKALGVESSPVRCYVAVNSLELQEHFNGTQIQIISELPRNPIVADGRPPATRGPFAAIDVCARDLRHAATVATARVSSALAAVAVFSKHTSVRSPIVTVERNEICSAFDTNEPLMRERRRSNRGEIARIVASAVSAAEDPNGDPVIDAIRLYDRALSSPDRESRFMLLWLGIERLCAGAPGHGKILSAVRAVVPKTMALAKIRREIMAFVDALEQCELSEEQRATMQKLVCRGEVDGVPRVDRRMLFERILGDDASSRALTAVFYEADVRLTQWYCRLRKRFGDGAPEKLHECVATCIEDSRRRTEWQVLRLYRARNNVAHAGYGPLWLGDLIHHAHYYLTQMIAVAVHYRETAPRRPPSEIFAERVGRYDVYVDLLSKKHSQAVDIEVLLRPTLLFTQALHKEGM